MIVLKKSIENVITKRFKRNKKIRYYLNIKNIGAPKSRNLGFKKSRGHYINFLDDDDLLDKTKIREQVTKFNKSKVKNLGVVVCDLSYKNKVLKNHLKGFSFKKILGSYCLNGINPMLIKREVLKKIKFRENLVSNQEYDLQLQISRVWNFDYVKKPLCSKLDSYNQISTNFKKKLIGLFQIIWIWKKYYFKYGIKFFIYNLFRYLFNIFRAFIGLIFGLKVYLFF